ncbi:hypothetical protein A1O3_03162 [Capronia epimyces CBS 606.96]|uniref:Uncharacterized protein n=1 Tax=Capronia epimyces CBS 606.96 TaxID=1182542 RepID=W9YC44_9EURO|nr:uncharacterized protein A1O3_03162 [Capronia epimyces CBS 606.96]EXJ90093.1 hypothetical protein A1O3_03162 [Capronia epimyces CBS 606.96]
MDFPVSDSQEAYSEDFDPVHLNAACIQQPHCGSLTFSPFLEDDEESYWETVSSTSSECETKIGDGGIVLPDTVLSATEPLLPIHHNGHGRTTIPPLPESPTSSMGHLSPLENEEDQTDTGDTTPPDDLVLPEVIIEDHLPGENDMMSGAVDPQDDIQPLSTFTEESVMCDCKNNFARLLSSMPFKVIGRYELATFNLPFDDVRCLQQLPPDFLTTYFGVGRAMAEATEDMEYSDDAFLEAMAKRGGTSRRRVVYPEDIIPFIGFGEVEDGEDDGDLYDQEYWRELQLQGEIWDDLYVP